MCMCVYGGGLFFYCIFCSFMKAACFLIAKVNDGDLDKRHVQMHTLDRAYFWPHTVQPDSFSTDGSDGGHFL